MSHRDQVADQRLARIRDWVEQGGELFLRANSAQEIAEQIGVSRARVQQILWQEYPGLMERVSARRRGAPRRFLVPK